MAALHLLSDDGDTAVKTSPVFVSAEEIVKTPRLPRWTRQEILVLIEGKRVVENRIRRGRASSTGMTFAPCQVEPKWSSVSSYCKRHGVNRGPIQCRKRWSNLAGDYKKIKEWESEIKDESDSFWVMRNDLRKERKLAGFFDREVYEILEGKSPVTGLALALGPVMDSDHAEIVFDSGRSSAAGEDELFSDDEELEVDEKPPLGVAAPVPISEKMYQAVSSPDLGGVNAEPPAHKKGGSSSQNVRKRKRNSVEDEDTETTTLNSQDKLIDVLEKNGKMLHSQLQVQNNNLQLDREQRKHNAANLMEVLNKMADAMAKIAEKL